MSRQGVSTRRQASNDTATEGEEDYYHQDISSDSEGGSDPDNEESSMIHGYVFPPDVEQSVRFTSMVKEMMTHIRHSVIPLMSPHLANIYRVSALYLFWIVLHYLTAQLYVQYCAHPSFWGFITAPFLVSAPHCMAMRWIFSKGGTLIEGMWIILGTWLCSKLITPSPGQTS